MYSTLIRDFVSKIAYGLNYKHKFNVLTQEQVLNDWFVGMNK